MAMPGVAAKYTSLKRSQNTRQDFMIYVMQLQNCWVLDIEYHPYNIIL